jgi:hypothetical protein
MWPTKAVTMGELRPVAVVGIGQVLTMPIFFASNAIYPLRQPGALEHLTLSTALAEQRELKSG